ncbi:MAG: hypothetical protein Q7S31_00390, partial [bacterium]|nr:hypothetical protein [bacterium]
EKLDTSAKTVRRQLEDKRAEGLPFTRFGVEIKVEGGALNNFIRSSGSATYDPNTFFPPQAAGDRKAEGL